MLVLRSSQNCFSSTVYTLYGSSLWLLSSPALHSIEVAFNNILRKIWRLPRHSHTEIVHSVANLHSLFNVVFLRSQRLMLSAMSCSSLLARQIFSDSCSHCYSFSGYNSMFGHQEVGRNLCQRKSCTALQFSLPGFWLWRYDLYNHLWLAI